MARTNRHWIPSYLQPDALLPKVPETRNVFRWRPYLIQDFIGKSISFLQGDEVKQTGLEYDPRKVVPCRWKCSDESLFGVDLAIFAHTRAYPFNKGLIGGHFNTGAIGAAVHHGSINVDIGGSHVGYVPGSGGGSFGKIWRPATRQYSTDCGYLMAKLAPFLRVYKDACRNVLVTQADGGRPMVSIPNEYVQPSWSSEDIKLLVDLEKFTDGEVEYQHDQASTRTMLGRSLFHLHPAFLETIGEEAVRWLCTPKPRSIGRLLTHHYFQVWDTQAVLHDGLPEQRLSLYMKYILAARHSPEPLKAAVINTALEHNRLTDAVRDAAYLEYDFVSFSGIFIDQYSNEARSYVNLFQPMGMTIKPRGHNRELEFSPEQIHEIFQRMPVAEPAMPLEGVFGYERPQSVIDDFTYEPGKFFRTVGS